MAIPTMDPQQLAHLGIQNPFAPPVPPPPSPSVGFQPWANSQQNMLKIQPAMTPPDAPLQPGLAAANPPKQAPLASANPPSLPTFQQDQAQNPGKYVQPIVRGTGTRVLNSIVAGLQGAAGGLNHDPGAGVRYAMDVRQHDENVPVQNQQIYQSTVMAPQQAELQRQKDIADIAHTQAQTTAIPINTDLKRQQNATTLAQHGLKVQENEDGTTSVVPDESSPVFQQQQQKNELLDAQTQAAQAQIELRNAQAAFEKAKTDPNSPLFKQTSQRLAIAQQNAAAAGQRAQAYMGRYLQSAYNTGLNGEVLPGATVIADDSGNQSVVGTGNASHAAKAQASAAQFNDVHGALDTVENSAKALVNSGGKLNDPVIAAALAQPHGTVGEWVQGKIAKGQMTPAQRDYVLAIQQAHENVQALRKAAGGAATDAQVAKLDAMIPNASTPDLDYLTRQTEQIRATAQRLGKGVVTSTGGLSVRGQGNGQPPKVGGNALKPPTVTYKQTATGPAGQIGSNDGGQTWFDVKTGKKVQ